MGEEQNVLEIKELKSYFYTEKGVAKAVDGVNITIPKGKIIGLVGESGCGKSMTARSIMGLLKYPAEASCSKERIWQSFRRESSGKSAAMIFR